MNNQDDIDKLIALGNSATGNQGFSQLLQRKLGQTGKPLEQLTIAEAQRICNAARVEFNNIYR